ncbi:STAS domain-containing protein [Anoxynatronum buryatiense]|uniref:Anti-sigma B factor antagonist n=1 Tax=Anoxynatronum buryatiense TaxID=489973 RepID=A0AA45WT79_9CLOT|nr:STAS domain-containing protein [Anoxynatronum buryatiense]SMP40562.1 anti-sigma B factor antagonist [Anoxynatronum buryatiense]
MQSLREHETITLFFAEEPTANSLNDLLQQTYEVLDQHQSCREVVIDMSQINYIDSAGITFLIGLYRNLARNETKLRIKGARTEIRDLFQIVNLTELFQVEAG